MSSSRPKKAQTSDLLPCPECGELQMGHVTETCKMADGFVVENLSHLKCRSCGARFFDDTAMHVIESMRVSHPV